MGLLRGGFVFFLGILLFFSFLAMNSFFILGSSLKYENVKEGLYPIIQNTGQQIPKELIGDFNITKAAENEFSKAKRYCANANNTGYVFSYEGYTIKVPCASIVNSNNSGAFINESFDSAIYDIYYKQYDCDFWDCFSKTELPFFLVSEKAKDYWQGKFYFFFLLSLILIALIFLFSENRHSTPITVGILLILSALPLLKIGDLLYALAGKFSVFLNLFLNSTKIVFLLSLILGLLLIAAGISFRVWNPWGIKEKLSRNEVREIVRQEMTKEKQQPQQEKQKQVKQGKKKK